MEKKYLKGYTTGVFDMFHIGHLRILERAKERCETLVVGVSTDELVSEYKNKLPIVCYEERAAIVAAIRCVDQVVPQRSMDKLDAVREIGCDAVFVGSDWKGTAKWVEYEAAFRAVGVEVVYLPHTDGISSSILREKLNERE